MCSYCSCTGSVRHLAGQPVPNVAVEAFSAGCNHLHEECVTSEEGLFKIRGLQPNCEYVLQIKPGQNVPTTIPTKYIIRVMKIFLLFLACCLKEFFFWRFDLLLFRFFF